MYAVSLAIQSVMDWLRNPDGCVGGLPLRREKAQSDYQFSVCEKRSTPTLIEVHVTY